MSKESDWTAVVERKPQGYVELNNGIFVIHGPIDSVYLEKDQVIIKVKWAAKMDLNDSGLPGGDWKVISRHPYVLVSFPNHLMDFEFEETPDKGPRVRFGTDFLLFVLYLGAAQGVDPKSVKGLLPTGQ